MSLVRERGMLSASLFCSYARGEATPESDIDLVVDKGPAPARLRRSRPWNRSYTYPRQERPAHRTMPTAQQMSGDVIDLHPILPVPDLSRDVRAPAFKSCRDLSRAVVFDVPAHVDRGLHIEMQKEGHVVDPTAAGIDHHGVSTGRFDNCIHSRAIVARGMVVIHFRVIRTVLPVVLDGEEGSSAVPNVHFRSPVPGITHFRRFRRLLVDSRGVNGNRRAGLLAPLGVDGHTKPPWTHTFCQRVHGHRVLGRVIASVPMARLIASIPVASEPPRKGPVAAGYRSSRRPRRMGQKDFYPTSRESGNKFCARS